jgi:hypothetical protein
VGGQANLDDNLELMYERESWLESGLPGYPLVQVNGKAFPLADIATGAIPVAIEVCKNFAPDYNKPCRKVSPRFESRSNFLAVALVVLAVMFVAGTVACLVVYRKVLRRRMLEEFGQEVKQSIQEYQKFSEMTAI